MTGSKQVKTAVIAAAGSATRMWPASKVMPKELFPLGKLPAIAHVVSEFVEAGLSRIILVVAEQNMGLMKGLFDPSVRPPEKMADDPVVRHFESLMERAELEMIPQWGNYGNAMPLVLAADLVGDEPCVYAFGDDIVFGENAARNLLGIYRQTRCPVMAAQEVEPARKSAYGIAETYVERGIHYIRRIIEKPAPGVTDSNLATFGRYLVTPDLMRQLRETPPGKDGEIWFVDGVIREMAAGGRVCVSPLTTGVWYTVGDPKNYADAVKAATESESSPARQPVLARRRA